MLDLLGNHIVCFLVRRLKSCEGAHMRNGQINSNTIRLALDECANSFHPGLHNYCLLVLMFKVPDNYICLVIAGRSYRFLGINKCSGELMCLAERRNTVPLLGI